MREIKVGDKVNIIRQPTIQMAEKYLGRHEDLIVRKIEKASNNWYHLTLKSMKGNICTYREQIELSHKINKIRRIE